MTQDNEAFLSRWSRLKREEAAKVEAPPPAPAPAVDDDPAPPLPPIEGLTPESDFKPFMHAKVPLETRREALKKLFADPQFGLPDPYEAYSEDWTVGEPIPMEMLKTLNQAKKILFDEEPKPPEVATDEAAQDPAATSDTNAGTSVEGTREEHGNGRQDT